MKVLLYRGKSCVSKAIQLQTRSPYSHVAIEFSDGKIIEAWHTGGKHFWSGTVRWIDSPWDGHDPATPIDVYLIDGLLDEQAAQEYASLQIGKAYDFKAVFRFLSRRQSPHEDGKWFCSELCAEIFEHGGLPLLHGNSAHFNPRDISISPILINTG
jgi:uncharacterized protein YycO